MSDFSDRVLAILALLCMGFIVSAFTSNWLLLGASGWGILVVEFCLGVGRAGSRQLKWWLGGIFVTHLTLLLVMLTAAKDELTLIFGLPLGSALVIYGIWTLGILPSILFSFIFDRWILPPENVEKVLAAHGRGTDET